MVGPHLVRATGAALRLHSCRLLASGSSPEKGLRSTAELHEAQHPDPGPPATYDDIPVPFKPYSQEYARQNAKFNLVLLGAGGFFAASLAYVTLTSPLAFQSHLKLRGLRASTTISGRWTRVSRLRSTKNGTRKSPSTRPRLPKKPLPRSAFTHPWTPNRIASVGVVEGAEVSGSGEPAAKAESKSMFSGLFSKKASEPEKPLGVPVTKLAPTPLPSYVPYLIVGAGPEPSSKAFLLRSVGRWLEARPPTLPSGRFGAVMRLQRCCLLERKTSDPTCDHPSPRWANKVLDSGNCSLLCI